MIFVVVFSTVGCRKGLSSSEIMQVSSIGSLLETSEIVSLIFTISFSAVITFSAEIFEPSEEDENEIIAGAIDVITDLDAIEVQNVIDDDHN